MADFIVTTDGKYLYVGIIELLKNAVENLIGLDTPDIAEEILQRYDSGFSTNDYNIVFKESTGRVSALGVYFSVKSTKTKKFKGYTKIADFWKNAKQNKAGNYSSTSSEPITDIRLHRQINNIAPLIPNIDFIRPKTGDRIILAKRKIEYDGEDYSIVVEQKTFTYPNKDHASYPLVQNGLDYIVNELGKDVSTHIITNNDFLGQLPNFLIEPNINIGFVNTDIKNYVKSIRSKKFKRTDNTRGINQFEIDIVESVAFLFNELFSNEDFVEEISPVKENLQFVFDKHFQLINDVTYNIITQEEYDTNFNLEYFQRLRVRLLEFHTWTKGQIWLFVPKTTLASRIYGLFTHLTTRYIDYGKKVELLKDVLTDNWFISGRWNPFLSANKLTDEELLVRIIQSIAVPDTSGVLNYNDINDFMNRLNESPWYEATTKPINLFQILYNKINDQILFGDDGKGARGQFVNAVYLLWVNSRYNPNSIVNESIAVDYEYTTYNATWKFDDPDVIDESFDETATPVVIDYESEKLLLWYNDNFNFPFKGNKIVAMREVWKDFPEILVDNFISLVTPIKPFSVKKYIPHGFYSVFQPIAMVGKNVQTIIKIPVNGSLDNPCNVPDDKNGNFTPIFFLKYVDDLGDKSDFKETLGLVTDVVLTFSGIGNITKLRHLNKVSKIRRYLTGTGVVLTLVEKQLIRRALRGVVFATWETILGTASILHNVLNNNCQNLDPCNPPQIGTQAYAQHKRCLTIDKWLFALDLLTLSGDVLARRYFKKISKDLKQELPNNYFNDLPDADIPNDLPSGHTRQKSDDFLDALIDIDVEYNDFLEFLTSNNYSTIRTRVEAFQDPDKRFAFMFDFKDHPNGISVLDELKADPDLIDVWDSVEAPMMRTERKKLSFLRGKRSFLSNQTEAIDHTTTWKHRPKTGTDELKFNDTGGHTETINFTGTSSHISTNVNLELLDPYYSHNLGSIGIDSNVNTTTPRMQDYIENVLYSNSIIENGHIVHNNILVKRNPQPSQDIIDNIIRDNGYVLNGIVYKKKTTHTVYNWTEEQLKDIMTYAFVNKESSSLPPKIFTDEVKYGKPEEWIETTYVFTLPNGVEGKLKVVNFHRYNERTTFYYNHITYIKFDL